MIASGLTGDVLVWEKERGFTGPKGIRTPDLAVKSRLLYRAELWARVVGLARFRAAHLRPRSSSRRPAQAFEGGPDHPG